MKVKKILETGRLILREMTKDDYPALCKILRDPLVMYAYEHAFSEAETKNWLDKQIANYRLFGFGLWAVILKDSGELIGQCGLTFQRFGDKKVVEIGYLFQKAFWGKGYATEAASACKRYAFDNLSVDEVFSIIRENNIASENVAKRNGMTVCGSLTKHYYGIDMPHNVFSAKRNNFTK